jgi:hypothetical protein
VSGELHGVYRAAGWCVARVNEWLCILYCVTVLASVFGLNGTDRLAVAAWV